MLLSTRTDGRTTHCQQETARGRNRAGRLSYPTSATGRRIYFLLPSDQEELSPRRQIRLLLSLELGSQTPSLILFPHRETLSVPR
ncbi:unnamed protein product [Urochloa humidicola]